MHAALAVLWPLCDAVGARWRHPNEDRLTSSATCHCAIAPAVDHDREVAHEPTRPPNARDYAAAADGRPGTMSTASPSSTGLPSTPQRQSKRARRLAG